MSEEGTPAVQAAEAEVVHRRGPSIVWLIPIVAAVIGAIIWWQTSANQGPVITLLLKDGSGIEAGKTKVKKAKAKAKAKKAAKAAGSNGDDED